MTAWKTLEEQRPFHHEIILFELNEDRFEDKLYCGKYNANADEFETKGIIFDDREEKYKYVFVAFAPESIEKWCSIPK